MKLVVKNALNRLHHGRNQSTTEIYGCTNDQEGIFGLNMFKPPFGQTNTSSFGFTGTGNTTLFGQPSVFGKTVGSAFPPPSFGTSGSNVMFGAPLSSSGSLFGSTNTSTFGQAQTTQPSFGFGTTAQQSNNLFGTQQNAGSSLFSSGTSSAFGANKPAFGSSFGTGTTGIFGAQQPTQTTSSLPHPLFGQTTPATGTSLFGSSPGTFGASNQQTGTAIKFNAVTGSDTMIKNGVSQSINTRHFCITCMKEYENKSLEELRYEDYLANRKGPQQMFGTPTQQPSLFATSNNLFGSQPTENKSLFGTNTNTSLGFGTNTNVFGSTSTANTSLFNNKPAAFGTTTTTSQPAFGFGAPATNSVFGNTQNKPFAPAQSGGIFGPTMNQSTTAFGSTGSSFLGFGSQANQSIGLFPNKQTTPFTTGTTTTGFNFGSNAATSTNIFGAKPATSAFSSTPVIGGFTGGFGTNNTFGTSTAQSNSLFKTTTSNFSFGTTQNTGTLGTTSTLFGNNAPKPGLFGSTTGSNLFGSNFGTGTSTFGNTNVGLGTTSFGSGSLFGNTSTMQPQTNTSTTHPAILALASVPFVDSPLFKNLLPATGKADALVKPSNAVTQKAMMACKDMKVSPKNSVKIKLKPLAAPLTKKSLFEGLEETEVVSPLFSTNSNVKKLVLKPKSMNNSVTTENWTENNSNKENQLDKSVFRKVGFADPLETPNKEEESFYIRRNPLFKPQRNVALNDLEQTSLVCNRDKEGTEADVSVSEANRSLGNLSSSTHLDETVKDSSKHSSSLDETRGFLNDTSRYDDDWQPHPTRIINKRLDYYTLPPLDDLTSLVGDDGSCIVDNFCIGRYGYGNLYFEETMDVAGLDIDEIVHFRHKEVNVYPDDDKKPPVGKELNRKCQVTLEQVWPVDKTTREPIKDPERLLKLKYEEKLRRSAAKMGATFIEYRPNTGSWVFKVDHFSKYGITDSDEEDQVTDENKVPLAAAVKPIPPGAGGDAAAAAAAAAAKKAATPQKTQLASPPIRNKSPGSTVLSPILPAKEHYFPPQESAHPGFHLGLSRDRSHEKSFPNAADIGLDIDEEIDEEDDADGDDLLDDLEAAGAEHLSPTVHLARRIGIDSHRVQLMKASLFEQEHDFNDMGKFDPMNFIDYSNLDDLRDDNMESMKLSRGLHSLRTRFKSQIPSKALPTPFEPKGIDMRSSEMPLVPQFIQYPSVLEPPRPKTVNIVHAKSILPLSESCISSEVVSRCISDEGIFKGRGFRNGWGPCSSLISLTTFWRIDNSPENGYSLEGRGQNDLSPAAIQRLHVYNKVTPARFKDSIVGHLMIQLEHSTKGEEDGCPIIAPQSGVDALHAHCLLISNDDSEGVDEFSLYNRQVWELCVALWGNLPTLSPEDEPSSHKTVMMRKEAITEWLKKGVSKTVQEEVESHLSDTKNPNRYVSAVLSSLSGREIEKACSQLQQKGDHFAALLLTCGQNSKIFIQDQLAEWQNVSADSYIDDERLKLFSLSSGLPFFNSSKGIVNTCENLDWKRAFAIHFWYIVSSVSTIADVIAKYENAFEKAEAYVCRPSPPYSDEVTTSSGRHIHDLCYNLLKLYCFRSHPLEQILNPATYSSDPLDYRLSWLLEKVLASLGYVHVSPVSSAITCVSFASQLEGYGLWQWAVFVYLHLPDSFKRKQAVLDVIGRHVTLTEDRKLTDEEEFLLDELNIPTEWIFRAKATRALSQFRYHDATYYLIQAREWNEAHQVIIGNIAADAVINEHYDYLRELLQSLVPNSTSISEWFQLGQLLWDYLEVNRIVQQALAEQNIYELESRQSQISSICARIVRWPCKTAKDRLCQAEIAKRMAHIFRNVMQLHGGVTQGDVTEVIAMLPLPEDYAMEELRQVKKSFPEK